MVGITAVTVVVDRSPTDKRMGIASDARREALAFVRDRFGWFERDGVSLELVRQSETLSTFVITRKDQA